jgi:ribosomal protein S27E
MPAIRCTDCTEVLTFPEPPSEMTCPTCGLRQYMTADGHTGRLPDAPTPGLF